MKNTAFFKIFLIFALSVFLFSCNSQQQEQKKRIVIWTSCSEFVQYIELFNTTHKENSAILVYKENPALSIPPASDETPPDIIVGSWLRNDKPYKNFKPLDYIFYNKIFFRIIGIYYSFSSSSCLSFHRREEITRPFTRKFSGKLPHHTCQSFGARFFKVLK